MSARPEIARFTAVDHTQEPDFFVRFMDEGHKIPDIRTCKSLLRQRLGLRAGISILDVGCGPGISLTEIATIVGPGGRCIGVDASETMVAAARRRAVAAGVSASFEVADGGSLPYPDGTFDACHAERVLMHVPDVERALAEMIRVVRPGGRVGVFDIDQETMVADSPDRETTRTIVHTFTDAIRNGWIGRQLPRRFRERGLTDVTVDTVVVFLHYTFAELLLGGHCTRLQEEGVLTAGQVHGWWEGLRAADERGMFLLGFTAFIVTGAKPGDA
jgi:ubiquinone/menaquinone biosynthesis C-methylase UbiE